MNLRQLFSRIEEIVPPAPIGTHEITEAEYTSLVASDDYHSEQLTKFRVARALRYEASDEIAIAEPGILMLSLAIQLTGKPASILEFGGGTGYHSTTLRRLLPGRISRYVVVETAEQVAAARGTIKNAEFHEGIPNEPFDIVFSSGALQYTQSPLDYLAKLCAINAPIMVFARNFFSERQVFFEQVSSLHDHGSGAAPEGFPAVLTKLYVRSLSEADFLNAVPNRYSIVTKIRNDSGIMGDGHGTDYLFRSE